MSGPAEPDLLDTSAAGQATVRGGIVRVAGYVAGTLVTVVSAAVLFRALGVDAAGRYVLVLSIATLAAGVTDAGLSALGVRELSVRAPREWARLMGALVGLRITLTVLGGVVACAYAALAGLGPELVLGTAIAAAGVLVQNLQNTWGTVLVTQLRIGWVTVAELLRQVATAIGIVVVAAVGGGLLPFLAVAPAAGVLAAVLTATLVRGSVPLWVGRDWAVWRELARLTLPYAAATAVVAVYFRGAIILLDLLSTERETGLFGASFRVVEVLMVIPGLAISTALPIFARAARDDPARLAYALGKVAHAMAILGAAVLVGLVAGAPFVIAVVAGPDFADAEGVMRIHGVAMLLAFVSSPWGYALLSSRRHADALKISVAGLVVLVVAVGALAGPLGAEGAALGTVLAELTMLTAGYALARRAGIVAGAGRALLVVPAALVALAPALVLPSLPAVVLGELVLIGMLLALRAVPGELLELVPSLGRRSP